MADCLLARGTGAPTVTQHSPGHSPVAPLVSVASAGTQNAPGAVAPEASHVGTRGRL